MSRLLKSLNDAQRERLGDEQDQPADTAASPDTSAASQEPGDFWVSIFLLALVCGLIVGGYLLLRDMFPAIPQ